MTTKPKSSRSKDNNTSNYKMLIFGAVAGIVLFFAFVSLFALILLKTDIFSDSFYMPAGLISGALSSFIAGFTAVRSVKKNGVVNGALCGLIQALICSVAVFFINGNNSGSGIFILMAVIIALGALGGISAVNLKVKKRYK